MKNMLLLVAALLLSSCQSTAPESSPVDSKSLPLAVTKPSNASREGGFTSSLQDGLNGLQNDLQLFYNATVEDLDQLLEKLKVSPPTTGPAAPTR